MGALNARTLALVRFDMLRFHNNSDSRQTQSASTIRIALLTANSYTNSLRTRKDSENCCLHFLILPLRGLFAFPLVQLNARSLFVTIKIIGKFSLALRDFLNITQFVTSVVRTTPAFGIQSIRLCLHQLKLPSTTTGYGPSIYCHRHVLDLVRVYLIITA